MKVLHGIGTGMGLGIPNDRLIPMIGEAGFEAFFTGWSGKESIRQARAAAESTGLFYQSVHSPFKHADRMWLDSEDGEPALSELLDCLRDCAEFGVGIMIVHPIIGMDRHRPTSAGIDRFAELSEEADRLGVKIAYENVEGIEYLIALRDALSGIPSVGFCWDTGHEMCYNGLTDIPFIFGDKLIATHFNDNMGQTEPKITWYDDLHLLPFDGVADWKGIAERLDRAKYTGVMTFEVTKSHRPEKMPRDVYGDLDASGFLKLAYAKALKLDSLRAPQFK